MHGCLVSGECCVLSDRGFCIGLISRQRSPTECGVSECDVEALNMRPWCTTGCCAIKNVSLVISFARVTEYAKTRIHLCSVIFVRF